MRFTLGYIQSKVEQTTKSIVRSADEDLRVAVRNLPLAELDDRITRETHKLEPRSWETTFIVEFLQLL